MNGNHILVYNNGSLIGASKSCDLQTDAETIEKSSPTSGQWREQVTKRRRWSVTVNYLLFYGSSLGVVGGGERAHFVVVADGRGQLVQRRQRRAGAVEPALVGVVAILYFRILRRDVSVRALDADKRVAERPRLREVERIPPGAVEGEILFNPRGEGGFGYDPLFWYDPMGKTLAEMSAEEKNAISHRGAAVRQLAARLARRMGLVEDNY